MAPLRNAPFRRTTNAVTVKQVVVGAVLIIICIAYLLQITVLNDIAADGDHPSGGFRHGKNNINMAIPMPMPDSNKSKKQKPFTRQRITEVDTLQALTNAYKTVDPVVQPPLGAGTDPKDPSLRNYDSNFRGTDMELPENALLRSNRILYLITPTHKRRTQIVDLVRLSQTLRAAVQGGYHQRLYWIILEDAPHCTHRIRQMALESGIPFAHKAIQTPKWVFKNPRAHRGIDQRNAGLDTVEEVGAEGVVYFMDDDNAYHVQLFHELAYTTHVSVFGVGMPGGSAYERCHVDPKTGKVDKLLTTWEAPRQFPMDMAGFAFATHHLARHSSKQQQQQQAKDEEQSMRFTQKSLPGYLENDLILQMAHSIPELEPLAANCTRILSWHVKTVGNDLYYNPEGNKETFQLMTGLV